GQHRSATWHLRFLLPLYRSLPTQTPSTYLDPESGYETASSKIPIPHSFLGIPKEEEFRPPLSTNTNPRAVDPASPAA
ncbi:MAG: hypothetical protein ABR912_13885, partial [Terracidiphilus sp.]